MTTDCVDWRGLDVSKVVDYGMFDIAEPHIFISGVQVEDDEVTNVF